MLQPRHFAHLSERTIHAAQSLHDQPRPHTFFSFFISFLVPLTGIALGFDAINSEYQNRTLGRVLSQPIYRDVLLFGKALGAVSAMAIVLLALWLLVIDAMLFLGVPPSGEQIARAFAFYVVTLLYALLWYLVGMMFSIIFHQSAVSALVAIALWLFFMIFWPMISSSLPMLWEVETASRAQNWNWYWKSFALQTLYRVGIGNIESPTRSLGVVPSANCRELSWAAPSLVRACC